MPRPGWAPDPLTGWWDSACASHPGVLGSIPKRWAQGYTHLGSKAPHHTHILLARVRAPYSPPRLRNGSFAHASRSGGPRNLLELQALHPAQPPTPVLYSDCTLLPTGRSTGQRNTTQSSTVLLARPVCPHVCDSDGARATPAHREILARPSPPCQPSPSPAPLTSVRWPESNIQAAAGSVP